MVGEMEGVFLKTGEGDSVLVEGGAGSGKEFFCMLLLREALEADFPAMLVSTHVEAHIAWFQEFARERLGLVRQESPANLIELGIALGRAKGCRFAYMDLLEVFSAKFDANAILESVSLNIKKLKALKASVLLEVNPQSLGQQQMSKLRELFDIIIEVKRAGERLEYRYARHPREFGEEWHAVSLSETAVSRKTLPEFCHAAMEYELKNIGHYGRNFAKFSSPAREQLLELSNASIRHFQELASILEKEPAEKASGKEQEDILREGLLEERVMKEKYAEYAGETGNKGAAGVFGRLSEEEKLHEGTVEKLIKGKKV